MDSGDSARVDWLTAAKSACLWAGVCLLVAALAAAVPEYLSSRAHRHVLATVTGVQAQADAAGDLSYVPHFRFRLPDEQIVQMDGVATSHADEFSSREKVPLMYPPGHPEAAVVATVPRVYPWALKLALTGALVFDIGCILWIAWRKRQRAWHQALRNPRVSAR